MVVVWFNSLLRSCWAELLHVGRGCAIGLSLTIALSGPFGTLMPMTSTATTHFRLLEAQGVTPGGPVSLTPLYPDPPATS